MLGGELTLQVNTRYDKELRVQRKLNAMAEVKKNVGDLQSKRADLINAKAQVLEERYQMFKLKNLIAHTVFVKAELRRIEISM